MTSTPFRSAHNRQLALWVLRAFSPGLARCQFFCHLKYADKDLARFLGLPPEINEDTLTATCQQLDTLLAMLEGIRNVRRRGCTFRNPEWPKSGYQAGLAHAARCLDAAQAEWLAGLPYSMRIPGAVVAHACLDEPEAFNSIHDAKSAQPTLAVLRKGNRNVGFFGHTHVTGIFAEDGDALDWLDKTRVRIPSGLACAVTVGAVGQHARATVVLALAGALPVGRSACR